MDIKRKFERQGPLWIPRYDVDTPGKRYERYRRRQMPRIGFTESQHGGHLGTSTNPQSASFTNNPAQGDVVVVGAYSATSSASTAVTVKDGNNNAFTVTPNSPSTFLSGAGNIWLFYLIAPANAHKTISVSYTGFVIGFFMEDFTVVGGVATFDKDVAAEIGSGSTINTPSITPAQSGELLWAATTSGASVTAPAAGATLGAWTGGAQGLQDSNGTEYILSSTNTATPVNYTGGSGWSGMVMGFYIVSTTPAPVGGGTNIIMGRTEIANSEFIA